MPMHFDMKRFALAGSRLSWKHKIIKYFTRTVLASVARCPFDFKLIGQDEIMLEKCQNLKRSRRRDGTA